MVANQANRLGHPIPRPATAGIKKSAFALLYPYLLIKTFLHRLFNRGRIDRKTVKKILAIRLYGVGNLVLSLPALSSLGVGYPESEITLMFSDPGAREIFSDTPVVNHLLPYRYGDELDPDFRARIKAARFDLAVVFYPMGVVDIPLMLALSGIRYRVGFKNGVNGRLYTDAHDYHPGRGEGWSNLDLAQCAGGGPIGTGPVLFLDTRAREKAAAFLDTNSIAKDDPFIVLHPGSQPMRRWPAVNYARLAQGLIDEFGVSVIIVGGPEEKGIGRAIARSMRSVPIQAAGRLSIKETTALIGRSRLFIGNDSGPMHIASALWVPVIALFGPTDINKSRPWGDPGRVKIIRAERDCTPCYHDGIIECVHDTNLCMTDIEVETVYRCARDFLTRGADGLRAGTGGAD